MKLKVKHFAILILTAAFLLVYITSCKKYPDGPGFSLLTKKARLCGTWQMEKYIVNGDDQTAFFNAVAVGYQIEIKKDDTYKSTANNVTIEEGKWEFTNNKEHVKTTITSTGVSTDNQILRLTNKELWIKNTNNNIPVELHLKAK